MRHHAWRKKVGREGLQNARYGYATSSTDVGRLSLSRYRHGESVGATQQKCERGERDADVYNIIAARQIST